MKKSFKHLYGFILALAAFAINFYNKDFAQVKFGPLYILEYIFLFWVLFIGLAESKKTYKNAKELWPLLLFMLYGFIRLLYEHKVPSQLTLQHCILFIYPFVWALVGCSVFEDKNQGQRLAWIVIFSNAIFSLKGTLSDNISIGPLIALPSFFLLVKLFQSKNILSNKVALILTPILLFFTFFPFWKMWLYIMQRTSLLILIFMALTIPLLINKSFNFKKTILPIIIILSTLSLGFIASSYFIAKTTVAKQFLSSNQHDDDIPGPGAPQKFQFRSRSVFWKRALTQWKANPLFGIGFTANVPELIDSETVAIFGGKIENPNYHLISGPHNSYINILARMGIIGLLLFIFTSVWWVKNVWPLSSNIDIYKLALIYIPINGALHAFLNTGFESPYNCFLMWLFMGGALATAKMPLATKK